MTEQLIDSHAHLDHQDFALDLEATIARAQAAKVTTIICVGSTLQNSHQAITLSQKSSSIYATAGIHPHDAATHTVADLAEIELLLSQKRVVALGEIGLDYHYDLSPRETQREFFRAQVRLGRRLAKPLIIHSREAHEDLINILDETTDAGPLLGVLHCFTGDAKQAQDVLSRGLYISFSGIVTFPKSTAIQEAARLVPEERLLVETDSPYLAPIPFRGRRNEPAFVVETVKYLARLRDVSFAHLAAVTRENTKRLFGLGVEKIDV